MNKQLENIFAAVKADPALAALVVEELKDGGVELTGADAKDLCAAAKAMRLAGKLPYYTAKALSCLFAAQTDVACEVIKSIISETLGIQYEVELIQDIAEGYAALKNGQPLVRDTEKVALARKAYERGYFAEKTWRGCAQCTLEALLHVVGNVDPALFRASDMMASGCGLFGDGPCGGYSGGLLFMGGYAGRHLERLDIGDREEQLKGRHLAALLHQRFLDTYGTIVCRDIHKEIFGRSFYLHDPDDKVGFEAAGAHKEDKCTAVVATASRWTVEILLDEGYITANVQG